MKGSLPIILLGAGAALAFSGGKKKAASTAKSGSVDEDGSTEPEGGSRVETVSGVRKDARGSHPWRISYGQAGFQAQVMSNTTKFAMAVADVGVSATRLGARELLRDYFNDKLLEAGFSEDEFKSDPVIERVQRLST